MYTEERGIVMKKLVGLLVVMLLVIGAGNAMAWGDFAALVATYNDRYPDPVVDTWYGECDIMMVRVEVQITGSGTSTYGYSAMICLNDLDQYIETEASVNGSDYESGTFGYNPGGAIYILEAQVGGSDNCVVTSSAMCNWCG